MRTWPVLLLSLIAATLLFPSCASTPVFGSLSPQTAAREAWNDIASDRMKIYLVGAHATDEVGISPEDETLIRKLPRNHSLPSGPNDPNATAAIEYARAYNERIVRYLRMHHAGEIPAHQTSNAPNPQTAPGAETPAQPHRPWWKFW
jgi:hypothetical protein